jgi:hypothetical protein
MGKLAQYLEKSFAAQQRHHSLWHLAIDHELVPCIEFSDAISYFALKEARKAKLD